MADRQYREAIVELIQVGNVVRATAMDPETLTEVTVVGPLDAGEELLRRTVLDKLDYVMRKRQPQPAPPAPAKPVLLDVKTYGPNGAMRKIR